MDTRPLKRVAVLLLTAVGVVIGAAALILLARSVENSTQFSHWELPILLVNICGVLVLGTLLARKSWQLYRDYRNHVPGSRLTLRMVLMFGGLVIGPLLIVYLFSLDFLNRGIDSWFRVEIKQGLNDALVLSREALDLRLREQATRTDLFARTLRGQTGTLLLQRLDEERRSADAVEIIVYDTSGRIVAVSSDTPMAPVAAAPTEVTLQIDAGRSYVSLDPLADGQYTIATASPIDEVIGSGSSSARRFVLIDYQVPKEIAALAEAVQRAISRYGNLSALRQPLKYNFRLALTLVLLLTLLGSIYGAIYSAQRLARPVQDLIAGTRAVGKGDFGTRLPLPSRDEMGFLVHSFNDMTKRLRRASEEAARSRQAVERERERLSIILSRLSTGVIVLDRSLHLHSANQSADTILGAELSLAAGSPIDSLTADKPRLAQFVAELGHRLGGERDEWREQLTLSGEAGERVLLWACTALPDEGERGGFVIVFDDITALLSAQRDAAWGEVARRLAHEIKNPLTPIQLSAERLRRKLLGGMNAEDAQLLERATHTIVQQVDAMKQMVNAFSEYARAPAMQLSHFNLNQLVTEVAELYRLQDPAVDIQLQLDSSLPPIQADRGRVRQILANLVTNGIEALADAPAAQLVIQTQQQRAEGLAAALICVADNGPGFRKELLGRIFDPYVTGKPRGTGLGLAIVKRIVEEHGGRIEAENLPERGARVVVTLPIGEPHRTLAGSERRTELRRERA